VTPWFSTDARQDLVQAVQWYLKEAGPRVAERFEADLQRALRLLSAMPTLGRPHRLSVRTWPLRHFPYLLVYRVQADRLAIIAVAHQSRAPDHWHGR
jgi:plasmid stabilization system protein ParE